MKYSELPALEHVGYADSSESLATILGQAVVTPSVPFTHSGRAVGGPCSCHLLSQGQMTPRSVAPELPHPYPIGAMAQEFFSPALIVETRRDPLDPPTSDCQKGWKVSKATSQKKSFVVVEACWTSRVRFPLF